MLPQSGVVLGGLKMFGEKKFGKMYNVYCTQTFLSCFFIFTSFNTTLLILLVKNILIRNCESMKGDKFRRANACVQVHNQNALVQNIFCSTIHLPSQHLLVQNNRLKHQINVWNLLKINNKDTRLMPLTSFWCAYC